MTISSGDQPTGKELRIKFKQRETDVKIGSCSTKTAQSGGNVAATA